MTKPKSNFAANKVLKKSKSLKINPEIFKRLKKSPETATTSLNNDFLEKINKTCSFISSLNSSLMDFVDKAEQFKQSGLNLSKSFASVQCMLTDLSTGFEKIDRIQPKSNRIFTQEFALEVKKYLCLDVENIEKDFFIHNGFNLLNEKFNPTNLNTYGTKLMDKLFSLNEMIEGTIEPQKNNSRALDQTRVDKIKICYLKKMASVSEFQLHWPSIVKSLRQKCIDIRNKKAKNLLSFQQNINEEFLEIPEMSEMPERDQDEQIDEVDIIGDSNEDFF